ncbi:MAG: GNAT family N-acetyltransferase [Chloroflexi bacterium]|nr:GNAT family N-acetyltransferase [Chloroflexota bacterium]
MKFQIRLFTTADQDFVLSLADRFSDFELPAWRSRAELDGANQTALKKVLEEPEPESALLLAVSETGQPAGFVYVHAQTDFFNGQKVGYLSDLAVDKAFEGQGVGRLLMESAEAWAREQGYPHLALNVFASNIRAREIYEKYDFQPEVVKYVKPLGKASA